MKRTVLVVLTCLTLLLASCAEADGGSANPLADVVAGGADSVERQGDPGDSGEAAPHGGTGSDENGSMSDLEDELMRREVRPSPSDLAVEPVGGAPPESGSEEAAVRVAGEVPAEHLAAVIADAASQAAVAEASVLVTRAEAVTWEDGSLGCPQPGVTYTLGIVEGYWVELEVSGVPFDYRLDGRGYFVRCGGGRPPTVPLGPAP